MARYIGAVCRLCRREGMKLFLKGERCYTEKCSYTRRAYPPGQHGQARIKLSEYAIRLREKQKMRRIYSIHERQFKNYFDAAEHDPGVTGENLLRLLETRLDNVVHRLGFASTRAEARQLVKHNHVLVNGKRVNIPSFRVKPNDTIAIAETSKKIGFIAAALAAAEGRPRGTWLEVNKDGLSGTFRSMPVRDEMNEPLVREQLVVEYYSR